jgi:LysM domain-containing protein
MKHTLVLAAAIAALGLVGCAGQKPMQTPEASPTPETGGQACGTHSYVVRKGDSLWTIAGKSDVMGNPFQWPLLFKANRDQIQDPDFIQVSEDLSYGTVCTPEQIATAVKEAQMTPAYKPHKRPRKVLPVQY